MDNEVDIRKLASDVVEGLVFTDRHIRNSTDVASIFLSLRIAEFTKEQMEDIGLIYEYLTEAGPIDINGCPTFLSCRFLTKKQTEELGENIEKYQKMKEEWTKNENTDGNNPDIY